MARTQGSDSEVTRQRLRAAALGLFARHGYASVSMRRIAAEVGVQVGALYNYIPDKQGLLFDLMQTHMRDLLAAWDAAPGHEDPLRDLERFTRFHIRYHAERPDEVFLAYMELRSLSEGNFAEIEALRREYEDRLGGILRRGAERGQLRAEDPKVASMALIAMLTGVNTWFRESGRLSLPEVEDLYWDMVRRLVAG